MRFILLAGTGGFIGSILRYLVSQIFQNKITSSIPWGTLTVNLIGCFLIGILLALNEKSLLSSDGRIFLATGICGGFTTFSAFSVETVTLMRDGNFFYAISYVSMSLILGLLLTWLGIQFIKLV